MQVVQAQLEEENVVVKGLVGPWPALAKEKVFGKRGMFRIEQ